jgi:ribosomal protein S18 acetylase RimI-like enzyme
MSEAAPSPFSIRSFCFSQDFEAVRSLWATAGPGVHLGRSDTPEEIQKKLQRDPDLFLIAEVEGRIAGAVMGGYDGRRGMIYHLAVEPAYRLRGIGVALMDELERRLRQKGCLKCYLLVTHDNLGAQMFYEAHGWERMELYIYGKEMNP